jgi:hypothetical protein
MRNTWIGGLTVALFLSNAPAALALPIISVDLDPATPGIQSTLSVDVGTSFTIDLVVTGDGVPFDLAIFETVFNSAGAVLGLAGGTGSPTAGGLAALGFGAGDAYAPNLLAPGAPMATGPIFAPAAGFSGQSGGIGMLLFGGSPFVGDFSVYSLTFDALVAGSSDIAPSAGAGLPAEGGLGFFGTPVAFAAAGATVTVDDIGPVIPEPSILALFALGLLGIGGFSRRRAHTA